MNKNDMNILAKFMAEFDKELINRTYNLNENQKIIIKEVVNQIYENFKRDNNIS